MQQYFKFTHFLHSLIPQMVCQQLYFNKHIIRPTMNLLGYIAYIVNFFSFWNDGWHPNFGWREENKK